MARRKYTEFELTFLKDRADRRCEYCKFPVDFSHDAFHVEHIIPPSKGGSDELDNLAFACDGCNTNKWAFIEGVDPETGKASTLFHPRTDSWEEHFRWSEDFSEMIGLTTKGRATIAVLKLNRDGLVNVRKALRKYGQHP